HIGMGTGQRSMELMGPIAHRLIRIPAISCPGAEAGCHGFVREPVSPKSTGKEVPGRRLSFSWGLLALAAALASGTVFGQNYTEPLAQPVANIRDGAGLFDAQ